MITEGSTLLIIVGNGWMDLMIFYFSQENCSKAQTKKKKKRARMDEREKKKKLCKTAGMLWFVVILLEALKIILWRTQRSFRWCLFFLWWDNKPQNSLQKNSKTISQILLFIFGTQIIKFLLENLLGKWCAFSIIHKWGIIKKYEKYKSLVCLIWKWCAFY